MGEAHYSNVADLVWISKRFRQTFLNISETMYRSLMKFWSLLMKEATKLLQFKKILKTDNFRWQF